MTIASLSIHPQYWETLSIQEQDLEFLYNHLLEIETPLTSLELVKALTSERIEQEILKLKAQQQAGSDIYLPKGRYKVGQILSFPTLDWKKGEITLVRQGNNPEISPFEVIEVVFDGGETRKFAAGFVQHLLNEPATIQMDDPLLSINYVLKTYGRAISEKLDQILQANEDLIQIAGRWFPRALLVDVNVGHLNLAEAVLEMEGGGPLTTPKLLELIELPTDVNSKLTEFSLNLALQEDNRFDEVGPAGVTLWFLKRMEPESVKNLPIYLQYNAFSYNRETIESMLMSMDVELCDELEPRIEPDDEVDKVTVSLLYPHWQAGTLPLSKRLSRLFPLAYEAPRVQFTFVDRSSNNRFNGWVVRPDRYVYGLKEWYAAQGIIPGGLITIMRGEKPGEVIVKTDKRRQNREWVRTALIGADGGIVFAMLKQLVSCTFNERMAIFVTDPETLDKHWTGEIRQKGTLDQIVQKMMHELAKLNPQGHVHAEEVYSAVNLIRRCPPGLILSILVERPWSTHLGDLYFRLQDSADQVGTL